MARSAGASAVPAPSSPSSAESFREIVEAKVEELPESSEPTAAEVMEFVTTVATRFEKCDLEHIRICSGLFCKKGCGAEREALVTAAARIYRLCQDREENGLPMGGVLFEAKCQADDILVRLLVQKKALQRRS